MGDQDRVLDPSCIEDYQTTGENESILGLLLDVRWDCEAMTLHKVLPIPGEVCPVSVIHCYPKNPPALVSSEMDDSRANELGDWGRYTGDVACLASNAVIWTTVGREKR